MSRGLLLVAALATLIIYLAPTVASQANNAYYDLHLSTEEGYSWTLHNKRGFDNITASMVKNVTVPGDIYGDLMNSQVIGDPFYRYGDEEYRWIAYDNFTYSLNSTVDCAFFSGALNVDLIVEGMQTITNISLTLSDPSGANKPIRLGQIGYTLDEFQKYWFNVNEIASEACLSSYSPTGWVGIQLDVEFESSVSYAARKKREYYNCTFNNISSHYCPFSGTYETKYWKGLPHKAFVRTEQSSFGWDWSPAFAPQGIYKPIYFRSSQRCLGPAASPKHLTAHFKYVTPHVYALPMGKRVSAPLNDTDNKFLIKVFSYPAAYINGVEFNACEVQVKLTTPSGKVFKNSTFPQEIIAHTVGDNPIVTDLYVENVELWWPNEYGEQPLHDLEVTLGCSREGQYENCPMDSEKMKLAMRSIELISWGDPLKYSAKYGGGDGTGYADRPTTFFRVKGVPIFGKGANMVPFDAFQSRVNNSFMEDILDSAVDAHMNIIRVWGGGLFPLDSLYQMAQEKGLMLWQEMIFGDASYPINEEFLGLVRGEIKHQLRRLGRYQNIVVWSGNNEDGFFYSHGPFKDPYYKLNHETVLTTVIAEDNSRPVRPTSPSKGMNEGFNSIGLPAGGMAPEGIPANFTVWPNSAPWTGDTHYYNYFTCPNVSVYPRTQFASEYGFQSLPWFQSFERVSKQEDWYLHSPWMNHRQHHPQGNSQIAALLTQNFQIPNLTSTELSIFKRVIYLTQIQQLLCIADEASFYRRGRDKPYRTMGSMYWQLNQNWQAPSWTSIDFGGVWKPLHYAMANVYNSYHLSAYVDPQFNTIVAHLASDNRMATTNWQFNVELIPFNITSAEGAFSTNRWTIATPSMPLIRGLSGEFFWESVTKESILMNYKERCPRGGRSCFLQISAVNKDDSSIEVPQLSFWLDTVREMELNNKTELSITGSPINSTHATVQISTSAHASAGVAPYVVIATDEYYGRFSQNVFTVIPGRPVSLTFSLRKVPSQAGYRQEISDFNHFLSSLYVQYLNQMWH